MQFQRPGATSTAGASGKKVDAASAAVTRRLQSELMSLMKAKSPGIAAFPEPGNLCCWKASVTGVKGTPYEALTFRLTLRFPADYPFTAPTVTFDTPCFHPNVDAAGNICLDILKDKWSAVYNVGTVLLSVQSLLGDPNPDSPLNETAARLWRGDREEYAKCVKARHKGTA
eukprot:TRINITY_DN18106_c0_g1_i1.p2 TRINITY_DN18106_c0_g1~~TRINITY_DN18106_c0_g1_i1.p2  ORF type:complete len:171 (+),score=48.55 TRINITY_DN18106_c0_g1_i1:22-534(+)